MEQSDESKLNHEEQLDEGGLSGCSGLWGDNDFMTYLDFTEHVCHPLVASRDF